MRDELLEVLSLAHAEIRRFAELPRCFPINRQVLPRLAELIDRLQGKRRKVNEQREAKEAKDEAGSSSLPLLSSVQSPARVSSRESWMLPPRRKTATRRFLDGSPVPERIARIEAFLAVRGSATVSELRVHLGLADIQVRHALECGTFESDNGWPARFSNKQMAAAS